MLLMILSLTLRQFNKEVNTRLGRLGGEGKVGLDRREGRAGWAGPVGVGMA